ncbi:hypothetical protein ACH5RR_029199 [Cinchona calisaya]|uniref:Uncharacterized protein n=1 Tax=Cinchona calisaya TaxID=153742 RepID=A0ABD2YS68_9GENT
MTRRDNFDVYSRDPNIEPIIPQELDDRPLGDGRGSGWVRQELEGTIVADEAIIVENVRGIAKPSNKWNSSEKHLVCFTENGEIEGPDEESLNSNLGILARNGHRVRLTYSSWSEVPFHYLDDIWREVQASLVMELTYVVAYKYKAVKLSFGFIVFIPSTYFCRKIPIYQMRRNLRTACLKYLREIKLRLSKIRYGLITEEYKNSLSQIPEGDQTEAFKNKVWLDNRGVDTRGRMRRVGNHIPTDQGHMSKNDRMSIIQGIKAEIVQEVRAEIVHEVRAEIVQEVREEVLQEVRGETTQELKEGIRPE